MITIEVLGKPVPWAGHGGYGKHTYNKRENEMRVLRMHIRQQYSDDILRGKIRAYCTFYFEPSKSWSRKHREQILAGDRFHNIKPDGTNCWKLFEDCLKNIAIEDDCKIVSFTVEKYYNEIAKTVCLLTEV